jgi:hypothetical protein
MFFKPKLRLLVCLKTNNMKNTIKPLFYPAVSLALFFTACTKQVSDNNQSEAEAIVAAYSDDVEADNTFSDVYNDVSGVNGDIAIAETDIGADTEPHDPLSPHCYTITISPLAVAVFPKTVTIDFGTGCLCKDGKTRKGKIITVFTGRLKVPGAKATTTFEEYYVNDVHVEGTHIIQNNSTSAVRVITRTIVDGKLSKPNGNFILWNATHTNTQVAGLGTPDFYWDDEFSITGNASGQNSRNGNTSTWSRVIGDPLHKKVGCKWFDKGTITLDHNSLHTALLDFGDGSCNDKATVTFNGNTKTITLP